MDLVWNKYRKMRYQRSSKTSCRLSFMHLLYYHGYKAVQYDGNLSNQESFQDQQSFLMRSRLIEFSSHNKKIKPLRLKNEFDSISSLVKALKLISFTHVLMEGKTADQLAKQSLDNDEENFGMDVSSLLLLLSFSFVVQL